MVHRYDGGCLAAVLDGPWRAGIRDSTLIIRRWIEVVERPAARSLIAPPERYHASGNPWTKRYLKAVQGNREAAALRFYIGFFTRPAVEKGWDSFGFRKLQQLGRLIAREEPVSDVLQIVERTMLFDIHADLTAGGEGIGRQIAGIGHIKSQGAGIVFEGGLALLPVYETDICCFHSQVTAQ